MGVTTAELSGAKPDLIQHVPGSGAGFGAPHAPGVQAALAVDPRIAPMVAQVSAVNLLASVTQLSAFFTRRADTATALLAKDWIVTQASLVPGWTVSTHAIGGGYAPNVVAQKTGSVHPERLVVLGAHYDSINLAGGAFPAVVGRTDTLLVIGVDGNPTANARPGFGVLVVDPAERVQGVLLYEGNPIPGAPRLGEVSLGSSSIPLIGVQAEPSTFTDPSCPSLFPDSVLQ